MSEQKLDLILEQLGGINKRLDSHEDLIIQLIGIVKSTNEQLSEVQQDVSILKEDVSVLKGDVSELKEGQNRHDQVLESRALHSLEDEMINRELKRIK